MKHGNLSIFIPHMGCLHACSFCNQHTISNCVEPPDENRVKSLCEAHLGLSPRERRMEIAFFGGSFTALPEAYMVSLLEAASPFVESGGYDGIRISTRPDAISVPILDLLKAYHVTAIELGAQSMDTRVLQQNNRGHSSTDVESASELVKKHGFSLGLQMMTGLWGSSAELDWFTAQCLAQLQPDTMRIYPTLVLQGTALEKACLEHGYQPQTLEETVELCAELLGFFEEKKIPVIRLGLHDEPSLKNALFAGPYHPALRELCEGRLLAKRVVLQLQKAGGNCCKMYVAPESVSKMLGHGAFAVEYLTRLGYNVAVKTDKALSGLEFRIEDVDNAASQFGNTGFQILS